MRTRNDARTPGWVLHAITLLITLFILLVTRSGAKDSVEISALLQIVPPEGYVLESGVVEVNARVEGRPSEVRNLGQPRGTLTLQRRDLLADDATPQATITRNIYTSTADFSALRDVRVEVINETVPIRAWRLVERSVDVVPQFAEVPPSGWELRDETATPQSIDVLVREIDLDEEGAAPTVRTLPVEMPGPLDIDAENAQNTYTRRVGVELSRYMRMVDSGQNVTVGFTLQRSQERRDFGTVPLELIGADAERARLNVDAVRVRLTGAPEAFENFDGGGLSVPIQLDDYAEQSGRIAVEIGVDDVENVPDEFTVSRVLPSEVYLTLPERPERPRQQEAPSETGDE